MRQELMTLEDAMIRAKVNEEYIRGSRSHLAYGMVDLYDEDQPRPFRHLYIVTFEDGHVIRSHDPAVPCRLRKFDGIDFRGEAA